MDMRQFLSILEREQEQVVTASRSVWVCVEAKSQKTNLQLGPNLTAYCMACRQSHEKARAVRACRHVHGCACMCARAQDRLSSYSAHLEGKLFPLRCEWELII